VESTNHLAIAVVEFHRRLGIDQDRKSLETRRWVDAAVETRDDMLEAGADGVDAAMRFGNETVVRARSVTHKVSGKIAERMLRLRGDDDKG
jgi:hypothetical protein